MRVRERGRKRQRNGRWGGERREEKEREESVPRRQNSTSMKMANGLPPQFINKILNSPKCTSLVRIRI